ncbi:MAG: ATP-binding protein [Gaiellales bacterium]
MWRRSADQLAMLAHEVRSPVAALTALSESAPVLEQAQLRVVAALARDAVVDIVRLCETDMIAVGPLTEIGVPELVGAAREALQVDVAIPDVTVRADATRLRQALANVVANAQRHGTEVALSVRAVTETVSIEIRDDGPGVPDGLDVFAKGVSGAGSTGYGLWLTRSIVEAHGGTVELVRDGRPGACFRIVLPLVSASA